MVLDKTIVSGLNQARVLFETIITVGPSACLQLLAEHTQLAAIARKMLDTSKAATSATPPVSTPTPKKKDVCVSLHQVSLHNSNILIFAHQHCGSKKYKSAKIITPAQDTMQDAAFNADTPAKADAAADDYDIFLAEGEDKSKFYNHGKHPSDEVCLIC